MKLEPIEVYGQPSAQLVIGHLADTLELWRRFQWDGEVPIPLLPGEQSVWHRFIASARAIPSEATVRGLEFRLALSPAGRTLADVVTAGLVHVEGDRCACSKRLFATDPDLQRGYDWALASTESFTSTELTMLADASRKRSASLHLLGSSILVSRVKGQCDLAEALIVYQEVMAATDAAMRLAAWEKAIALGAVQTLARNLPETTRWEVADALADVLASNASALDWQTDARLGNFEEYDRAVVGAFPILNVPRSRLGELVVAEFAVEHSRHDVLVGKCYDDLASSLALLGHRALLGETIGKLPGGKTLLHLLKTLRDRAPQALAQLLWPPMRQAEVIHALAGLQLRLHRAGAHNPLNYEEEWKEVQREARRLFICPERALDAATEDVASAVFVGAWDEARRLRRPKPRSHERPNVEPEATTEPWRARFGRAGAGASTVGDVVGVLKQVEKPTEPLLIFALRLVEVAFSAQIAEAASLAEAVADLYQRGLVAPVVTIELNGHPALLSVWAKALRSSPDRGAWTRWLRPFDASVPLDANATHEQERDRRKVVLCHIDNLIAQLEFSDEVAQEEIVGVVTELYEHEKSRSPETFAWPNATGALRFREVAQLPFLVRLGAALGRSPQLAADVLPRLLAKNPTGIELAHLLWGGKGVLPSVKQLSDALYKQVSEELIDPEGRSIGEMRELAAALYGSGEFRAAECCAASAVEIATGHGDLADLHGQAVQLLKAALLAQERFADVLLVPAAPRDAGRNEAENLDAVALIGLERTDEALAVLAQVLARDPDNDMALINKCATLIRRKEWDPALEAVRVARERLENPPDELYQNEAIALWQKNDVAGAARAVAQLSERGRATPHMLELRVGLLTASKPTFDGLDEDLKRLEAAHPGLASDLRQRMAVLYRLDPSTAATVGLGTSRRLRFEERCRSSGRDVDELLLSSLRSAFATMAEYPSLANGLDENQLTQLITWFVLPALGPFGALAKVLAPGGHGRVKEGQADFLIYEPDPTSYRETPLVRAEAKIWRSKTWMEEGVREIFGQANTGRERFLSIFIYSKEVDFAACVDSVRDVVEHYQLTDGAGCVLFRAKSRPAPITDDGGSPAVAMLKAEYEVLPGQAGARSADLFVFVVDIRTAAAKSARLATSRKTEPS